MDNFCFSVKILKNVKRLIKWGFYDIAKWPYSKKFHVFVLVFFTKSADCYQSTIWLVVDGWVREIFRVGSLCDVIESESKQNTKKSTTINQSWILNNIPVWLVSISATTGSIERQRSVLGQLDFPDSSHAYNRPRHPKNSEINCIEFV